MRGFARRADSGIDPDPRKFGFGIADLGLKMKEYEVIYE